MSTASRNRNAKQSGRTQFEQEQRSLGGSELSQMELDVAEKVKGRNPAIAPGAVSGSAGRTKLSQFEQAVAAEQAGRTCVARVAPASGAHAELSVLKDAVTDTERAGVLPAELPALNDAVTDTEEAGVLASSGRAKVETEQDSSELNGQMGSGGAADMAPDVEDGISDLNNEGLLVAMPVIEDEEDADIQSAVQYDPDAKPHVYRRFRLYAFLAFFAVVAASVAAVIGSVVSGNADDGSGGPTTSLREASIEDRVRRFVDAEDLKQTDSPFEKARIWITHNDTMQINSESPNFVQRYTLAYFYFATTVGGQWLSCNPPKDGTPQFCTYARLVGLNPNKYDRVSWTRWLSKRHECSWAGIICDERDEVRSLELGKFARYEVKGSTALFSNGISLRRGTRPIRTVPKRNY